jgi:chemotaxis protein CheD
MAGHPRQPPCGAATPAQRLDAGGQVIQVLRPGDVAVASRGDRLETLLGSCVAVVLSDPRLTVGAMCHIVHAAEPAAHLGHDTSFARPALSALFAGLRRLGITPQLCVARVYGGGNMFPAQFTGHHVGASNIACVLALLQGAGIEVLSQCSGGNYYRKLSWQVGPQEPLCLRVDIVAGAT